jgi:hypothetical protein
MSKPIPLQTTPVASKKRLRATLVEISRLIEALPEPVCVAFEKTGIVTSWRTQVETLTTLSAQVSIAASVFGDVSAMVVKVRQVVKLR